VVPGHLPHCLIFYAWAKGCGCDYDYDESPSALAQVRQLYA
jgi:hypothetical protein